MNLKHDLLTIRKQLEQKDLIDKDLFFTKRYPTFNNTAGITSFDEQKFLLSDIVDIDKEYHTLYLKDSHKGNVN